MEMNQYYYVQFIEIELTIHMFDSLAVNDEIIFIYTKINKSINNIKKIIYSFINTLLINKTNNNNYLN